ncbi:MAG: twin-arginine translocase TatA/TatE family subunit, partial [Polyangiaceae bacterium]
LVALLLFGAGRIADIGKGLGQGIKNFKQGLKEADDLDGDKKPAANPLPAAPPPAPALTSGAGVSPAKDPPS